MAGCLPSRLAAPWDPRRPPASRRPPLPLSPGRSRDAGAGTRSMEHRRGSGDSDAPSTPRPEEPRGSAGLGHRDAGDIRDPRYPGSVAHSGRAAPMSHECGFPARVAGTGIWRPGCHVRPGRPGPGPAQAGLRPARCDVVPVMTGTLPHRAGDRGGGAARDRAGRGTVEADAEDGAPGVAGRAVRSSASAHQRPLQILVPARSAEKSRTHDGAVRDQAHIHAGPQAR
jgi:hypothetical protein